MPIEGKRSAGPVKSTKSLGFGFGGWSDDEDQAAQPTRSRVGNKR